MLRRQFIAAAPLILTEGARTLEQYHNSGTDPGQAGKPFDALEHVVFLKATMVLHYPDTADYRLAMDTAFDAVKKGWRNVGVWDDGLVTIRSLVGENPKTQFVERLPPLPANAERVAWTRSGRGV